MAQITGIFFSLSLDNLQGMQTQWQACATAIALNQSYSIAGRSFTRANLGEVSQMIGEISAAIARKNGTATRVVYADMSR